MNTFLQPIVIFWALLFLALISYKLKKHTLTKWIISLALIHLFVFGVSPLPIWLTQNLEQRYPVFNIDQIDNSVDHIVILGGGHTNDTNLTAVQKLHLSSLNRLAGGLELYHSRTKSILIVTGHSSSEQIPAAIVMSNAAVKLGVIPSDTVTLTTPANTWQEALAVKKRFPEIKKCYLVTSALHMPRAMETFNYHGFNPIAVPTDYLVKRDPLKNPYSWKPAWQKLEMTQRTLHEYLGIWYYRWFKQD